MIVRVGKRHVDVANKKCPDRPCYQFGFDKGTYVQGRGYTSYHKEERPVCLTRHLHGCPGNSVCGDCRLVSVEEPGTACKPPCNGITVARTTKP